MALGGYMGKLLRLNMTDKTWSTMELEESLLKKYVGGASLGAKLFFDMVSPDVDPLGPDNKIVLTTSPVTGTNFPGASMVNVVTKSAMLPMALSAQINGQLGRKIKTAGYDGIIIEGQSDTWQYVIITDEKVEFLDAAPLMGRSSRETNHLIREITELPKGATITIGQAGENLVKFASIESCEGHIASTLGSGCIMGSKKLKAVIVEGKQKIKIVDEETFKELRKDNVAALDTFGMTKALKIGGTNATLMGLYHMGMVPIKNLTESTSEDVDTYDGIKFHMKDPEELGLTFKRDGCYACPIAHCNQVQVTKGRHKGRWLEESEYEGEAVFGLNIGLNDIVETLVLNADNDEYCMDLKEAGFMMSWAMECYEKGYITKEQMDGLEMTWGNADAVAELLRRIAYREGNFANICAEGLKYASEYFGEDSAKCAVLCKGHGPHGHDPRSGILNAFFQCMSDTGSNHMGSPSLVIPACGYDGPLPQEATMYDRCVRAGQNSMYTMWMDTFMGCHFTIKEWPLEKQTAVVNAVTGFDLTPEECMLVGDRCSQILRTYNLLSGMKMEDDTGSHRMINDAPPGGLSPGVAFGPMLPMLKKGVYIGMGRDIETSKPLPETLRRDGLEDLIPLLWEEDAS